MGIVPGFQLPALQVQCVTDQFSQSKILLYQWAVKDAHGETFSQRD